MRLRNRLVKNLVNHYRDISLLNETSALLSWDLNVNMPPSASESRAMQSAYVTKLISDKWLAADFKKDLEKATSLSGLGKEELAIVKNLNQAAKYYHRVPPKIIIELSETTSKAFVAWREAREKNMFKIFEPYLKKLVGLNQAVAEYIGYKENQYDALLDLYEPGFTTKQGKELFTVLIKEVTTLLSQIKRTRNFKEDNFVAKEYPIEEQKKLADFIIRQMGYDLRAGRMDISAHPFTTELGAGDIRITNRYSPHNFIESIMVAMHEGGHALYEQGVNKDYTGTPLAGGVSLGIHESQSRFWENQVGRSREFCEYMEPILKAFYPEQLKLENAGSLYQAFNKVSPSLIRVEADEVTYNLHIALRFELEEALINGKIAVKDLPDIWQDKMKKYLGVVPKHDSDGVLQDVHWSHGSFGYFPTYTLGNLYAAQFTHFMYKELDAKSLIKSGNLGVILSWQRENIHKYGSLYWPQDLVKKVTGKPLSAKYFLEYLNKKYSELYAA